jgi:hypothetical protein
MPSSALEEKKDERQMTKGKRVFEVSFTWIEDRFVSKVEKFLMAVTFPGWLPPNSHFLTKTLKNKR